MTDTVSQPSISTLAVVGLGYVGLPTAVAFAESGLTVNALDVDETEVRAIREGRNPLQDTPLSAPPVGFRDRFGSLGLPSCSEGYMME